MLTLFASDGGWFPLDAIVALVVVVVVTGVELLAGAPKLGCNIHLYLKRLETKKVFKKNICKRFLSKSPD